MEPVIFSIEESIIAHSKCKVILQNAIKSKTCNCEITKMSSPHKCDLGIWLDTLKFNLIKYPVFKNVYDLHIRLHIEMARVLKLILDGKVDEAKEAMASGSKFASISSEFTLAMMKLEMS